MTQFSGLYMPAVCLSLPLDYHPQLSTCPFTAVTRVQIPPGTPSFSISYGLSFWQCRCPGDEWVTKDSLCAFLSDRKSRQGHGLYCLTNGVLRSMPSAVASMDTYEKADSLLDVLEKAPVGAPEGLFRDHRGKQWMESCVIRAVKKLQAAEYHHANIESEIQDLHKMAEVARKMAYPGFTLWEEDRIAFELDAFLAAARSCIDFVSGVLAIHSGENHRTSIRTLLKEAKRNSAAPFSGFLTRWREWIGEVKEYRDECIHYRTLHMMGGHRVESRDGDVFAIVLPFLVPEKVPPDGDKPTIRRGGRGQVEILAEIHTTVGIAGVPPSVETPVSREAEEITENLSELSRARQGMVPVEDFCGQHLEKLHRFVSESFQEVIDLGFPPYVRVARKSGKREDT